MHLKNKNVAQSWNGQLSIRKFKWWFKCNIICCIMSYTCGDHKNGAYIFWDEMSYKFDFKFIGEDRI